MDEIGKLMVEQLRDTYSAERQQMRAVPKVLRRVTSPTLKEAIQAHQEESETQVERLEQALEKLGGKSGRKVCEGMRGLVEEAQHELDEHDKGPLLDCVIIAALQRAEHYEMAAYGSIIAMAKSAGETEIAASLATTLEEEKQADARLSAIAEQEVNPAAIASVRGGGDEEPSEPANENRRGRKKATAS